VESVRMVGRACGGQTNHSIHPSVPPELKNILNDAGHLNIDIRWATLCRSMHCDSYTPFNEMATYGPYFQGLLSQRIKKVSS
jgi:hypothetical protein